MDPLNDHPFTVRLLHLLLGVMILFILLSDQPVRVARTLLRSCVAVRLNSAQISFQRDIIVFGILIGIPYCDPGHLTASNIYQCY